MSDEFVNYVDWMDDLENIQAQDGSINPPEIGTHKVEVVSFEKKASQSKNKPQVQVKFKVVSAGESQGRQISGWYTLDPSASDFEKGRLKQLLLATGLPLKGFNLDNLKGKALMVDVTERQIPNKKAGQPGQPDKVPFRGVSNERPA